MQFASRVLLFIHQQADGLQNRDLLKFVIARTVFFRPTLTPHCVCCSAVSNLLIESGIAHLHWRAAQVSGKEQERPRNDMVVDVRTCGH